MIFSEILRPGKTSNMAIGRFLTGSTLAIMAVSTAAPGVTATRWGRVDEAPGFQGWRAQLQHIVDREGPSPDSHFCVVVANGRTAPPDKSYTWAYVYWREAAKLYTFAPSNDPMSYLSIFKAPLDLHKDVVPRERDVHGSTFLVTRSWLHNVLSHCAKAGAEVLLRRSA